jgi:phenylalanine-4-hydroxylase
MATTEVIMPKSTAYTAKTPNAQGVIPYTSEDNSFWRDLFAQQMPRVHEHCAPEYLDGLAEIDLPADRVPQCVDLSNRLMDLTGWRVEPVPALIGFKTFFSMLANKTFPAASFIRNRDDFDYIEEPDIFHEIFGHTPLLTDPRFAKFSETIGKAGVQADKSDYSWLIRLYWFTIEFGLIQTDQGTKALGSGLASSPTELIHATGNTPLKKPFDVIDILRTPYRIDIPQPIYFVLTDADQLFETTTRELLADVKHAQSLGLHAPTYVPKAA